MKSTPFIFAQNSVFKNALVASQVVFCVSCSERNTGSNILANLTSQNISLSAKQNSLVRTQLDIRLLQLKSWAVRCEGAVAKDKCDVGDALLFDGILCLSGEAASCVAVRNAQGPDGRMWRAQTRIGKESVNSFSRDMSLGVLAYLVATKDVQLALQWMNWIQNHDGKTCSRATDNRCSFTPGFWNLFGDVWKYLGLPKTSEMENDFVSDVLTLPLQVSVAPSGYPMHLLGVNLLIRKAMNASSLSSRTAASILLAREPQNPFFQYLSSASHQDISLELLKKCPESKPPFSNQWSFERANSEQSWLSSMGWECIALINFLRSRERD